MNFKMKAVVAALALTASMSASAAMTNTASGDSSLILTLLDNTNNISATFDLGLSYSTFAAAGTQSWNVAAGDYAAAWNSFIGTANLAGAGTHWAVFSGDNLGAGVGSRGMIVSYASGSTMTGSQMQTGLSAMDTYINAQLPLGNHSVVADGASSAVSGNAFAESASAYGVNGRVNGQGTLVTWASFDKDLGVVQLKQGASNIASASFTTIGNQYGNSKFNMSSNGVLSYTVAAAPVPEADTWAMLLAGLGLMGFIARRRTAA